MAAGDGFTTALLDGKKLVFINDTKDMRRMRFTLAHELGHVALNHKLDPIARRNTEFDEGLTPDEMQANVLHVTYLCPLACLQNLK